MKKHHGFLLVFTLVLSLFYACDKQSDKPFSVMTWNIWHGGLHGDKAGNFKEDTLHTENVLKVLLEEQPDIVFMQETYCCGMEIAKKAGYQHSWRGSSNLSIHSKFPIVDTLEIYKPFNSHGVVIDINGEKVLCVNLWLHYLPDYFRDIQKYDADSLIAGEGNSRLKEIKSIIKTVDSLEEALQLPVIVGGDFNSGSHLDWIEATKEHHYNKVVEWPVSKFMEDSGYSDTFRKANPDPTKTLEGTWGYLNDEIISDRIDFIYFKGNKLKTLSSKIVMDDPEGGFFNSDHRAIHTNFKLSE